MVDGGFREDTSMLWLILSSNRREASVEGKGWVKGKTKSGWRGVE